ncbi:methyltransferase [Arenimonas sp. GDDSR-1]|uniref:class I SAM-dependent methyltransferase n=1 Tax=Arenimonas sp. GDDSR-1 TaxID=2950125 RepID=UPI00261779B1|nr:methyltransferase [Arenimonas sp. GDDSR-1]
MDHEKGMTPEMKAAHHREMLQQILKGDWRDPKNTARDQYRHPLETLTFFGITPHSKVIEIWPGAGWYSEIIAPYATKHGSYTGAVNNPATIEKESSKAYYAKQNQALRDKFAAKPEIYGKAVLLEFDPAKPVFGAPGSADAVLTFRNVHNWRMAKQAEGMFAGFFAVLKKGGTLGVVEHRAAKDVADDDKSGYVSEAQVIALATKAGFKLDARSEVNANPKDTKDYPGGVWTLPPTYGQGDKDRAKYQAIGESDRMTLRFVKP